MIFDFVFKQDGDPIDDTIATNINEKAQLESVLQKPRRIPKKGK